MEQTSNAGVDRQFIRALETTQVEINRVNIQVSNQQEKNRSKSDD